MQTCMATRRAKYVDKALVAALCQLWIGNMGRWLVANWFAVIVAACTVVTTIVGIMIDLLAIGWLEFLWRWHESLGW